MTDDGRVINTETGEEEVEEVDNHDGGVLEEAEVLARGGQERGERRRERREERGEERGEKGGKGEKGERKVTQYSAAQKKYQQKLDAKKERERQMKKQRSQLMRV